MTETERLSHKEHLNPSQLDAVEHLDGPLLVLAGAGTGKTRVLTSRVANIIQQRKAYPSQILAVTFTNKAAAEMRHRISRLLEVDISPMNVGTFHSIAARILRANAQFIGFNTDFTIIDYDDQIRIVKKLLERFNIDDKNTPPKLILYLIGRFKDKAYTPKSAPVTQEKIGRLTLVQFYAHYQEELRSLNAMDFGDLLLHCLTLFNQNPEILKSYQAKFKYILVDEYQDTNVAQYLWLRMLAEAHNNICCVGDDDQSIYGWRGAEITNILRFDEDFNSAKIVRLEQNYRSTECILQAASHIIAGNVSRHKKQLWTETKGGELIKLHSFRDDKEEARFIADEIEILHKYSKLSYAKMAILLRAGYQTRAFEESLNFLKIPYTVVGGTKFYERMEIRDALAYIRFLVNPEDTLAFERIVATPRRGIGQATLQKFIIMVKEQQAPFFLTSMQLLNSPSIKGKGVIALRSLFEQFSTWAKLLEREPHDVVVRQMLQESGYVPMYEIDNTEQSRDRLENLRELVRSLSDFSNLREYLEHVSLITDTDTLNAEARVSVMTIHAAKGLEFDTVFLGGWEEGVFPTQKSIDERKEEAIEEERRLAYVAITRARQRLYITYACQRRIFGSFQYYAPSRFIAELPAGTYERTNTYGRYLRNAAAASTTPQESYSMKPKPIAREDKVMDTSAPSSHSFRCGDRVMHHKFGTGTLISLNEAQAVVVFEQAGIKKIMIDYITRLSS